MHGVQASGRASISVQVKKLNFEMPGSSYKLKIIDTSEVGVVDSAD